MTKAAGLSPAFAIEDPGIACPPSTCYVATVVLKS